MSDKTFKTYTQQMQILIDRGLIINHAQTAKSNAEVSKINDFTEVGKIIQAGLLYSFMVHPPFFSDIYDSELLRNSR